MYSFAVKNVGELCDEHGGLVQTGPFGSQLHASDYVEEGIPVVMPVNIGRNTVNPVGIARINESDHMRLSKYQLRSGDIVYSRRGDIGRHAYVTSNEEGWLCGTGCLFIRFDNPEVDPRYVSYFLDLPESVDYVYANAVGTTMLNLNTEILRSVPVRLPEYKIQRKIADILGALDDKIELNRRMNGTLEQMAMALYKHWLGEGNEEQKISDLIDINPSISIKKDFPTSFIEMKVLPVDSMSVSDDDIVIKPFTSGSKFMNDDILFARITPCLENGKTAFVDFLEEGQAGFGSTEFLIFRAKENCCPQYVYCLSRDPEFRAYAIKSMVGTSGRQRVQTSSISEYLVAKPDPGLMNRFDETTKDWFYQIRSNTKEIVDLKKVRDYLLPRLLSGEIEVKAAEEQIEEVLAGG